MKAVKRWSGMRISRHLLAAAIMFVVMFLYRKLALPHFSGLDTQLIGALVAGVVGGAVWWIVFRGKSSR